MNYEERIERRPNVAGGEAVIKGTRVTLRTVLASLAEGATTAEILEDFPTLTEADVRAAIAFAAASAQEDLPVGGGPRAVRIKLDENLPAGLVPLLQPSGTRSIPCRLRASAERTTTWCGARHKRTADFW